MPEDSSNRLQDLVYRYERQRETLRRSDSVYSEADTRAEFIDPFFELLGWDVANIKGLPLQVREVVRETQVAVDEHTKRPDYVFRLGRERSFFVEAKSPNIDLLSNPRVAFQTRRYGWSANLMISVAMNFESLVIYDTTSRPLPGNPPNHSRLHVFSYHEYVTRFDEISSLLSREAVYSGQFDSRFSQQVQTRPAETIDTFFLETLNQWRLALGRDVINHRPGIDLQTLNEVVQRFILRVLFLRMCEDRGIQTYEYLRTVAATNDWAQFVAMLQKLDRRFDSELFGTKHDPLCQNNATALRLDSSTVAEIIESLYFPQAPYTFSVLEPEFLGDVYEQFLAERLDFESGVLQLLPKPGNVDRDVVPTPRSLINRIVQETVDPLVRDASPEDLLAFRVLDPASGSGGFLLAAFDVLIARATEAYQEIGDFDAVVDIGNGYQLTFEKKCEILTNCVFGVDRDFLAVEVTRFGLLAKLLEQETQNTLPKKPALLPSLQANIVLGDALVDDRIYAAAGADPGTIGLPLTWGRDIVAPFDVVIGNPPYLFTEAMLNQEPVEYGFYQTHYSTAYKQFDKYFLFIERALTTLLKDEGVLGMVVSRKFAHIEAGKKLRSMIAGGRHLVRLVDFGTAQLFEGRTNYVCLLFLSNAGVHPPEDPEDDTFDYEMVSTPTDWLRGLVDDSSNLMKLTRSLASDDIAWLLPSTPAELKLVLALLDNTVPLGDLFDVFNGIQTSCNDVYVLTEWEDVDDELIAFTKAGSRWLIEREILKPFYEDNLGALHSFHPLPASVPIIFPYFIETQPNGELRASVIPPAVIQSRFPYAYAWLEHNKEVLKKRNISPSRYPADEWYRYGRVQALTVFEHRPKIVVGVNSLGDKYVYDESNTLLASGGTAGECAIAPYRDPQRHTPISLYFIFALLNHKAIEYYCRKRGSPFRGGWYARGTAVLETVPVPIIDFENPDDERVQLYAAITQTCEYLCDLYRQLSGDLSAVKRQRLERRARALKRQMDNQISELYGIAGIIDEIELPT